MTEYEALQIILDLAYQNAIGGDVIGHDPILEVEYERQQHALDVVEKLAKNLKTK